MLLFKTVFCAALCLLGIGTASATLLDRGPDMVYDDVLNITWTRNGSVLKAFGMFQDGTEARMSLEAKNFVFGGFDDWRLPYASVSSGVGPVTTLTIGQPCTGAGGADEVACRDNEMAYMFYYNLGGTFGNPETGDQTAVGGEELTGIQASNWSDTRGNPGRTWRFGFSDGRQSHQDEDFRLTAWAVRDGDVAPSAAPEPATLALLGLGLAGLGFSCRKQA